MRGRSAIYVNRLAQSDKERGTKLLFLKRGQKLGQKIEISRRFLDGMNDAEDLCSHGKREESFHASAQSQGQKRIGIAQVRRHPPDQERGSDQGKYQRQDSLPSREHARGL